MNKILLLLFLLISFTSNVTAQDPDPALFQTWYLYSVSADLEDPQYYFGEDVPQMTIHPDFSFTAKDNCWDISGNFLYDYVDIYEFTLETINYDESCTLGGSNGFILKLVYQPFPIQSLLYTNGSDAELIMSGAAGFDHVFLNRITLSTEDFDLDNIAIYPNPAKDFIVVNGLQNSETSVTIYTISGAIAKKEDIKNTTNIDVSNLQAGVYFAEIVSEGKTTVKKFIKE